MPSGLRTSLPEKMTSSSERPRKLLVDVSPKTQRNASTKFDLPDPLGPTIAVTPSPNSSAVGSANVLNPKDRIRVSFTRARPPHRHAANSAPPRPPPAARPSSKRPHLCPEFFLSR